MSKIYKINCLSIFIKLPHNNLKKVLVIFKTVPVSDDTAIIIHGGETYDGRESSSVDSFEIIGCNNPEGFWVPDASKFQLCN